MKVVHPLTEVLAKKLGLLPEQKVMGSRPVTSSQIIGERVKSTRDTDKQKVNMSGKASSSPAQIQSPVDIAPPPAV